MSIKKNIVANYVGQGVTSILNVALIPVYIRYLGIETYGLIGLFTVIQMWLVLLDAGMSPTLSREMARYTAGTVGAKEIGELLHSLTLICFVIAVAIAGTIALGSGFLASHWLKAKGLPQPVIQHAAIIMAVVVAIRFCDSAPRSALVGLQRQVWLSGSNVAMAVLRNVGVLAVLRFSPTIEAFLLWQLFISIVTVGSLFIKLRLTLPEPSRHRRFSLASINEIRGFAGGMFWLNMLAITLTQIDKLILSKLLTLAQFGYYMLASNITTILLLVVAPVTQAIYPQFVQLADRGDTRALAAQYHRSTQLISLIVAPAGLILFFFPHTTLFVWSNNPILAGNTAPLLALLAIGTLTNATMYIPHQVQLAYGWTRLSTGFNTVAVAVLVPSMLLLVPRYGPIASAALWALLNVAYMLVQMPLMHRRYLKGELRPWYLADNLRPIATAALVMALARLAIGDASPDRLLGAAVLIVTWALSCAAAFLGAAEIRRTTLALLANLRARARPA